MLLDIAYKLARKILPTRLYEKVSYDYLGRRRNYENIATYRAIFEHYRSQGLEFQGKTVVEVGSGLQNYTGLFLLAAGARHVHLVEPKGSPPADALGIELARFRSETGSTLVESEVAARLTRHRHLDNLPAGLKGSVDLALSYTVLEHVRDLGGLFRVLHALMAEGAVAYHMVDVSDHTYQVFARWKATSAINDARALYHLRYAPGLFRLLNDSKCWMNRVLMPEYLQLSEAAGFSVRSLRPVPYPRPPRIHPGLLSRLKVAPAPGDLGVTAFSLLLRKPIALDSGS